MSVGERERETEGASTLSRMNLKTDFFCLCFVHLYTENSTVLVGRVANCAMIEYYSGRPV